jgi:hypothetical protein
LNVYEAPDLRAHVLNAASRETSRGFRLSKKKQSLKIDGTVALSFAVVAAEQFWSAGRHRFRIHRRHKGDFKLAAEQRD